MRAVNLIPTDAPRADRARIALGDGLAAYVVLAVLAVLVVMAGVWAVSKGQLADTRNELSRVKVETASAETRATALTPYIAFAALRQARVETVGGLLDQRVDWSRRLREIGRVVPRDVDLTSLVATASAGSQVEGGGAGESARSGADGPAIDVVGCARTQPRVAALLVALRAIGGVRQVNLASSEKSDSSAINDTECRATDEMPQFAMTITYDALPVAAPAAAPTGLPAAAGAAPAAAAPAAAAPAAAGGAAG